LSWSQRLALIRFHMDDGSNVFAHAWCPGIRRFSLEVITWPARDHPIFIRNEANTKFEQISSFLTPIQGEHSMFHARKMSHRRFTI
jgi:hypothetical protein